MSEDSGFMHQILTYESICLYLANLQPPTGVVLPYQFLDVAPSFLSETRFCLQCLQLAF
jgi:hypothetical protein